MEQRVAGEGEAEARREDDQVNKHRYTTTPLAPTQTAPVLVSLMDTRRNVELLAKRLDRKVLHGAGLRHDRQSDELTSQEMRRLYRALVETLHEAAKHRGSTLADGLYTDLAGKPGGYQAELKVYERDGQACKRCRSVVTKAKFAGKPVYFCPDCQV